MQKIKIPYRCLLKLCLNPQLLKAFCIYGKLKIIAGKKGFIFNYKSCKQYLSKKLEISENTLRKYVGILKAEGFVWESRNNLRVAHSHHIYNVLNVKEHICSVEMSEKFGKVSTKQLRLSFNNLNVDTIKACAIHLKQIQIEYKQKKTLEEKLIKKHGNIISGKIESKIKSYCKNKANLIWSKYNNDIRYNFLNKQKRNGFLDNNLALQSIANMFGRKSKTTSSKLLNNLKAKGLISLEKRNIPICHVKEGMNIALLSESFGNDGKKFVLIDSYISIRVPSKIQTNIVHLFEKHQ
jgi:predicted transcriptional regulator